MEDIKVTNVTVTPATPTEVKEELKADLKETAQAIKESLEEFSDDVINEGAKAKKARGFLQDFTRYIKSENFKADVNATAKKYNVPPKKLAENFFEKALGTIGDVLGVTFGTVGDVGHMLTNLLATIIHGAIDIAIKVANALARVFTFNKTCVA
jgi:hypothetical protein